ncbi:MAG: transporter substrate-binding domain-containing protein [Rhodospirillales bacterium]|jgi:polar amino acid transport system substrate-binding protein|nr:transporter substrate-binding domain-containing protein [Rhodospirillales bacterium]
MRKQFDTSRRDMMKLAVGAGGVAAGLAAAGGSMREAHAQLLDSGVDSNSVLARIKKENKLRVGYSQTVPWFQKSAKTGGLIGIYHDVAEKLAKALEVEAEYHEVSWANATVALRKGDFDVFGSSLFYTMPRALVVNYVGPMWHKGRLAVVHKDNAGRFKSAADFDNPDVTFSVNIGSSEENWVKTTFPKAKIITTSGNITLAAEPVRAKKADIWATGDLDAVLFARKNSRWAHVVNEKTPIGMTANTWAIRYGDDAWKYFLDMWADHMVTSGYMKERYDHYLGELSKG